MGLFLSTFINKIDRKGRISVPAPFRAAVTGDAFQGVVLFPSAHYAALDGVGMAMMETFSSRVEDHYALFSDDHDAFAMALFGESVALGFDENGRISLPESFLAHAGIDHEAAFVGMGRKFQIWSPARLAERKETARKAVYDRRMALPGGGGGE